ncbi:MAG: gamma-glutamyltransferase family protein [Hyphomicrobiaceae bacterium]
MPINLNANVEQWEIRKRAVSSERGVVAAQNWMAAAVGADILHKGGNAVDAAVATAFALNVVEPWMSGMGGSGYMVVWLAQEGRAMVVDFQGTLPMTITTDDYPLDPAVPDSIMGFPGVADNAHVVGYRSITVPGAVAGLSAALARYGRLGFDTVLEPAIRLADNGLPVDWFATLQIALEAADLTRFPESARVYLPGGTPARPEQFVQLGALAETLKRLAHHGPRDFYEGRTGQLLASDLQAGGSRITIEDLASYEALIHDALVGYHRGASVFTAGETSGGPRLNEALQCVDENLDLSVPFGAHTYVTYVKALNKAFASHYQRLGRIDKAGCTSHLSTVDADGNMVALTNTLLSRFGSKVMLPSTGMLMNNGVSYFDPRPGFPTTMAGGKRINSSNMCPTVCVRDGKALFAVGASGANHIVPCTMQLTAFLLDYGLSLEEAFNLPRIDAGGCDSVRVDPAMGEAAVTLLAGEFELEVAQNLVFPKLYSCPSGVLRNPDTGQNFGVTDKSSPAAGAKVEAAFVIDQIGNDGRASVRA